ncbi:MAG: OB-fold nucleic acid binding domain-containing protein, partial [Ruminococcus sp.]|nr:OB-fold nucleic acid binding domain-containing protein [Ruminococcus sp.]
IINERETGGDYKSLTDFVRRMNGKDINRRAMESLIKCGAFDSFPLNRREMLENIDMVLDLVSDFSGGAIDGQIDFFGMSGDYSGGGELPADSPTDIEKEIPHVPEYDTLQLLEMEREIMGVYISGHPLETPLAAARACRLPNIAQIKTMREGTRTALVCGILTVRSHTARNGSPMAFIRAEDKSGEIDCIVFAEPYMSYKPLLAEGQGVYIEGKLSTDRDGERNILADRFVPAADYADKVFSQGKLFIRCKSSDRSILDSCVEILKRYPGNSPVFFRFEDIKKTIAHNTIKTCRLCPELMEELYKTAGEDNAAVKISDS